MIIKRLAKIGILQKSKAFFKVAYGGRASGKSYGIATVMIARAMSEKVRILCLKETQNSISDSVLGVLKRVIDDYDLTAFFNITKHGLECINGSLFTFKGLQHPDRIRSLENYKYCWVEEAHNISNFAWGLIIPTIIRNKGAEIWVSFNPRYEDDPTYQMFVSDLDNRISIFNKLLKKLDSKEQTREYAQAVKIDYTDNKFLEKETLLMIEFDKLNNIEQYNHDWLGGLLTRSDALVFKDKYSVGIFEAPENTQFFFGADWGFAKDPTTLIRFFIIEKVLYVDYEAYAVGVDTVDIPKLFDLVPESRRYNIIGDSARPETISHLNNNGFNVIRSKKGKNSIEDGISYLRGFQEIVIHERCKRTITEFNLYKYKVSKLDDSILPDIVDDHNHIIDALRYATEPLRAKQNKASFKKARGFGG